MYIPAGLKLNDPNQIFVMYLILLVIIIKCIIINVISHLPDVIHAYKQVIRCARRNHVSGYRSRSWW